MDNKNPFPVLSFGFVKSYWIHMRPYLLFISGIAGLSGLSIVSNPDIPVGTFILAFIPFFLGYGFGQALTDSFQTDTDAISSPYRPVVQGLIRAKDLKWISVAGLMAISCIIIPMNVRIIPICILMILGLATYTFFKKNFWMAGPFYNAAIVMLLTTTGYMLGGPNTFSDLLSVNLLFLCGMTFFSYANFVLIGYLKDIEADRQTNYNTFPVKFGWNKTVILGDLFLVLAAGCCFLQLRSLDLSVAIAILGTCIAVWGQVKAHSSKLKNEMESKIPILATIRAFVLWHMAVIYQVRPEWWIFLLIFYLLFEITLASRPVKNQI